jgi:hypothetical protein
MFFGIVFGAAENHYRLVSAKLSYTKFRETNLESRDLGSSRFFLQNLIPVPYSPPLSTRSTRSYRQSTEERHC